MVRRQAARMTARARDIVGRGQGRAWRLFANERQPPTPSGHGGAGGPVPSGADRRLVEAFAAAGSINREGME